MEMTAQSLKIPWENTQKCVLPCKIIRDRGASLATRRNLSWKGVTIGRWGIVESVPTSLPRRKDEPQGDTARPIIFTHLPKNHVYLCERKLLTREQRRFPSTLPYELTAQRALGKSHRESTLGNTQGELYRLGAYFGMRH